jgi:AcrR family transcriptional regulator
VKEPVSGITEAPEAADLHVDGRSVRWNEHRAIRREELIDAALAAIDEHGSEVGLDQIAAAARTSKPVIYRYFADKNELYRAVGKRVITRIVEALHAVAPEPDPRSLMLASIDAYLQLLEDHPQLFRFVTQNRLFGDPTSVEFNDPVSEVLTAALGEQLRSIGLDPGGARPWGQAVVGFIRTASLWWLDNPATMTRQELTDYLGALLWGGGAGIFQLAGRDVDARPAPGVFRPLADE